MFRRCFQVFSVIHRLTRNPGAIELATRDVIEEFASDGVRYLELRTTPRAVPGSMTCEEYLEAVIRGVE